jgi:hypothetical protein
VILKDPTGEIRLKFFKTFVEKWFEKFQEGDYIEVTNFATRKIPDKYHITSQSKYELQVIKNTLITVVITPSFQVNGTLVYDLKYWNNDSFANDEADVYGIVLACRNPKLMTCANERKVNKADIVIVDYTGYSIVMSFWGDWADRASQKLKVGTYIKARQVRCGQYYDNTFLKFQKISKLSRIHPKLNQNVPEEYKKLHNFWKKHSLQIIDDYAKNKSSGTWAENYKVNPSIMKH